MYFWIPLCLRPPRSPSILHFLHVQRSFWYANVCAQFELNTYVFLIVFLFFYYIYKLCYFEAFDISFFFVFKRDNNEKKLIPRYAFNKYILFYVEMYD